MKSKVWRAAVEVGFIVFLFYSNLLMGELERTSKGRDKGLLWDLYDIFTWKNFIVALVAGLIGHVLVERLRTQYVRRNSEPSALEDSAGSHSVPVRRNRS